MWQAIMQDGNFCREKLGYQITLTLVLTHAFFETAFQWCSRFIPQWTQHKAVIEVWSVVWRSGTRMDCLDVCLATSAIWIVCCQEKCRCFEIARGDLVNKHRSTKSHFGINACLRDCVRCNLLILLNEFGTKSKEESFCWRFLVGFVKLWMSVCGFHLLSFCCQVVTVLIFCICCVFFVYYTSNHGALGGVVFDLSGAPPSSCSHHSLHYIEVAVETCTVYIG